MKKNRSSTDSATNRTGQTGTNQSAPSSARNDSTGASFGELPDIRLLGEPEFSPPGEKIRFPGFGPTDFRIFFSPECHRSLHAHAVETTSVEVGGVLVGSWAEDDEGPYVLVSEKIRCDAATSKSGEVTFTHDAWNDVNKVMDNEFAHLKIVGWYHTHPGFGIFLSERDRFIHEHFFTHPGQIAFVVDPLSKTEGVFAWKNGQPTLWPQFWVGRQIITSTSGREAELENHPTTTQPTASPTRPRDSILSGMTGLLALLLVFLIGYLLAGFRSDWEQRMITEGTVAHYGYWKGMRPLFRESLDAVLFQLNELSSDLKSYTLAKNSDESKEKIKEQANRLEKQLVSARVMLLRIQDYYALSPQEEQAMAQLIGDKLLELKTGLRNTSSAPPAKKNEKSKTTVPEKNSKTTDKKSDPKTIEPTSEKKIVQETPKTPTPDTKAAPKKEPISPPEKTEPTKSTSESATGPSSKTER